MDTLKKIKDLCKLNGISLKTLEANLGFGNGSLAKASSIKLDRLYKIADYFQVPIGDLISEEDGLSSFARFAVLSNELEDSFFKLDDQDQQTILAMMKVMLQGEKYADREKR